MNNKPYRKAVTSIIVDDNEQFLIVQLNDYACDEWNFVGGGVDGNETYESALYREIEEETGLTKDSYTILGESTFIHTYDFPKSMQNDRSQKYKGQERKQYTLMYSGDKHALVFQKDEIRDHKWVPFKDLSKYLKFPGQLENAYKIIDEFNLVS